MLDFNELMAEALEEAKEEGLEFKAKDGRMVLLRPLLALSETELKNVTALLPLLADDKVENEEKLGYASKLLVTVADRKDSLKKSLAELPYSAILKTVNAWMEKVGKDVPES